MPSQDPFETSILLNRLTVRDDARRLDAASVGALVSSVKEIGFISPILVRETSTASEFDGCVFEIIAGAHRYEAAKRLGLDRMPCRVIQAAGLRAELAMIDENLMRSELSPADRAISTARRKAIYLELHPETAQGVAGGLARQGAAVDKLSFAESTAKSTGRTQRAVRREAERGEKIAADVLDTLRGTHLDKGNYLDAVKQLVPEEQRAKVSADLVAEPVKAAPREKPAHSVPEVTLAEANPVTVTDDDRPLFWIIGERLGSDVGRILAMVNRLPADVLAEELKRTLQDAQDRTEHPTHSPTIAPDAMEMVMETANLVARRMGEDAPRVVSVLRHGMSNEFADAISSACASLAAEDDGGGGGGSGDDPDISQDDDSSEPTPYEFEWNEEYAVGDETEEERANESDFEMLSPGVPRLNRHHRRRAAARSRNVH